MKSFENKYCRLSIEDGILHFIYKPELSLTLDDAKVIVADRIKFQEGVTYPVYCDFRGVLKGEKEARDYLANEGSALISVVALQISSPVMKVILNFYLNISSPKVPTHAFTSKEEALKFLNKHKRHIASV